MNDRKLRQTSAGARKIATEIVIRPQIVPAKNSVHLCKKSDFFVDISTEFQKDLTDICVLPYLNLPPRTNQRTRVGPAGVRTVGSGETRAVASAR
jgi:hypothetical protein